MLFIGRYNLTMTSELLLLDGWDKQMFMRDFDLWVTHELPREHTYATIYDCYVTGLTRKSAELAKEYTLISLSESSDS